MKKNEEKIDIMKEDIKAYLAKIYDLEITI